MNFTFLIIVGSFMACWYAAGFLFGVVHERRRQRRHRERVCERRWNERRREYRVVLDGIAERIHYGSKL